MKNLTKEKITISKIHYYVLFVKNEKYQSVAMFGVIEEKARSEKTEIEDELRDVVRSELSNFNLQKIQIFMTEYRECDWKDKSINVKSRYAVRKPNSSVKFDSIHIFFYEDEIYKVPSL